MLKMNDFFLLSSFLENCGDVGKREKRSAKLEQNENRKEFFRPLLRESKRENEGKREERGKKERKREKRRERTKKERGTREREKKKKCLESLDFSYSTTYFIQ